MQAKTYDVACDDQHMMLCATIYNIASVRYRTSDVDIVDHDIVRYLPLRQRHTISISYVGYDIATFVRAGSNTDPVCALSSAASHTLARSFACPLASPPRKPPHCGHTPQPAGISVGCADRAVNFADENDDNTAVNSYKMSDTCYMPGIYLVYSNKNVKYI